MYFRNLFLICVLVSLLVLPQYVRSESYKPFMIYAEGGFNDVSNHLDWCVDMNIQVAPVRKSDILIGDPQDRYFTIFENEFKPREITPYLSLEPMNKFGVKTLQEVQDYLDNNASQINEWFFKLKMNIDSTWPITHQNETRLKRFRFGYEGNTFGPSDPRAYYYACHAVYPVFRKHLDKDATMVICIAAVAPQMCVDYFRGMLEYYLEIRKPGEPLGFNGIDYHARNYNYKNSVEVYLAFKNVFEEVFENVSDPPNFSDLVFWNTETADYPIGSSQTVWGHVYEYCDYRDLLRYDIKNISQSLSIPNMLMINLDKRMNGNWGDKDLNGIFNIHGLTCDGIGLFDSGEAVISPAVDSLRTFSKYIYNYRPQFNSEVSTVRVFDYVKDALYHRYVLWNDLGYGTIENYQFQVPSTWEKVIKINLVTGEEEVIPLPFLRKSVIGLDVGIDPILLTPNRLTDESIESKVVVDVKSGVAVDTEGNDGTWQSILTISNNKDETVQLNIEARDNGGEPVGYPVETELLPYGVYRRDMAEIWPSFRGSLNILSSHTINGFMEYRIQEATRTIAATVHLQSTEKLKPGGNTICFLTQDWETLAENSSQSLFNELNLLNVSEMTAMGECVIYDETGELLSQDQFELGPFGKFTKPLSPFDAYNGFGKIEIQADRELAGQNARFWISDLGNIGMWSEEPLFADIQMLDTFKLKSSDSEISRLIVTNPWETPISGELVKKNAHGVTLETIPVMIASNETLEIVNEDTTEVSEFYLENEDRAFGRIESHTDNSSQEIMISSNLEPRFGAAYLLPYFCVDYSSEQTIRTEIILQNLSNQSVAVQLWLRDMNGVPVELEADVFDIDPMDNLVLNLSDLVDPDTLRVEGSLKIDVQDADRVTCRGRFVYDYPDTHSDFSCDYLMETVD